MVRTDNAAFLKVEKGQEERFLEKSYTSMKPAWMFFEGGYKPGAPWMLGGRQDRNEAPHISQGLVLSFC